jgi:protein tyrosine/serine phosphatase
MRLRLRVRHSAYAIVLLLGAAGPSIGATVPTATLPRSEASPIRIDNFGRVNDGYYRGAQPRERDYADLAGIGIKTVIDLTADGEASVSEAASVRNAGMKFVRIPLTTHDEPGAAAVTQFLAVVNDAANQPVYVHCQGGRHRTGTLTAIYRITHDGWSADRAFAEMQQYGFGPAFLHAALKNFVYAFHVPTQVAAVAGPAADDAAHSRRP